MTETITRRPGRNERCPCGSGKKYKQCCRTKDEAADRAARAEAAAAAPPVAAATESEPDAAKRRTGRSTKSDQAWKRGQQHALGFQKRSRPQKRGAS